MTARKAPAYNWIAAIGAKRNNTGYGMKDLFAGAAIVLLALGQSALPERAADQSTPAASNVPGAQSPSINPDRSIAFALKAPDANSVLVAGGDGLGKGPFPMTKGVDGTWSATTPPSVPGFHYYWRESPSAYAGAV